jgi:hypothetical protein
MRQRDLDSIKKAAVEKHDGNVEVAAAEHIYGEHVIARAGGQVPTGVDHDQIAEIVKAIGPVKNLQQRNLQQRNLLVKNGRQRKRLLLDAPDWISIARLGDARSCSLPYVT